VSLSAGLFDLPRAFQEANFHKELIAFPASCHTRRYPKSTKNRLSFRTAETVYFLPRRQ